MTRGFGLGKFMPPHAGHQLLCETAAALVDALTILVCWLPDDPIPGPLRLGWMLELFPHARVVGHGAVAPQEPADHPDFWPIWRGIARAAHPEPIDLVFASETYGVRLAAELGAAFRAVDPAREAPAVSASAVRAHPWDCWAQLPPPVRGYYARTICVVGDAQQGRAALVRALAARLDTIGVPDHLPIWREGCGEPASPPDLAAIGRMQDALAASLRRRCNRRLILDGDPVTTALLSDRRFGARDPWFAAWEGTADLYLVLGGADAGLHTELAARGARSVVVGGNAEAIAAIAAAGL